MSHESLESMAADNTTRMIEHKQLQSNLLKWKIAVAVIVVLGMAAFAFTW